MQDCPPEVDDADVHVWFTGRDAGLSRLWDDRGAMKRLLTLASLAAMIGTATPAYADGVDDTFLATLRAAGISFPDPARAIGAGKWVCTAVHGGTQMADVVKTVQSENPGLEQEHAAQFTAIAANVYCPTTLAGSTQ
jgi:Protein of unknown function (DUF732)